VLNLRAPITGSVPCQRNARARLDRHTVTITSGNRATTRPWLTSKIIVRRALGVSLSPMTAKPRAWRLTIMFRPSIPGDC
jgi:hypothetical protein